MRKKIRPLAHLRALTCNFGITRITDLGLFWPKYASVLLGGFVFPLGRQLATFRDQSAMLEEHLSQKLPLAPSYNPIFWPKCPPGVQKLVNFFPVFVRRPIKPLDKIFYPTPPPKKRLIFFLLGSTRAWSSNLCAAEFPHYNSDPVNSDVKGAKHLCHPNLLVIRLYLQLVVATV